MKYLSFLVFLFPALLFAQGERAQGEKIRTIKTTDEIVQATVDRAGDFYVVLKTGEIRKYDRQGEFLSSFRHSGIPTLFDPTNATRLLVYYKETGEYAWLSPNLEAPVFLKIDPSFAIEPVLLCPSGELNLWVLDASDFSMKKIVFRKERAVNKLQHQVSAAIQRDTVITNEFIVKSEVMTSAHALTSIREYQNVLFLFDQKQGIGIYNAFGKQIRFIGAKNIRGYNFLGEELYYAEDGKIKFLDMFTGEKSELMLTHGADFVVLTDERMILIKNDQIDIYGFQPSK
jgi:hypothetical protein